MIHHQRLIASQAWGKSLSVTDPPLVVAPLFPLSASYKPILLRGLLDTVDADRPIPIPIPIAIAIATLTLAFRDVYLDRLARGLPAEKPRARMARVTELTEAEIQRLILDMPFGKFAQRGFLD
jgi:hypothetical protein